MIVCDTRILDINTRSYSLRQALLLRVLAKARFSTERNPSQSTTYGTFTGGSPSP